MAGERLLKARSVAYRLDYYDESADEERVQKALVCFRVAVAEGRIPGPDSYIGKSPRWRESTVDAIVAGVANTAPKKRGRPAKASRGGAV